MPTQENYEGLPSGSGTKAESPSATLAPGAKGRARPSSKGTPRPSSVATDLTEDEALAILWTGVEALVKMGKAKIYHSPSQNRLLVEVLAVDFDSANGLKPLAERVEK